MNPQPTTPLDILDAQRYRWLRKHLVNPDDDTMLEAFGAAGFEETFPTESQFDDVITNAMQQKGKI